MSDFPKSLPFNPMVIPCVSRLSCFAGNDLGSWASGAWPAANRALFIPFRLIVPFTATRLFAVVGTDLGGVDLGIYNSDGINLISTGIGTPTIINSIYNVNIATTTFSPDIYYLAMSQGIVTSWQRDANITNVVMRGLGCRQMATAYPLPALAVYTGVTNAYIPLFGVSSQGTI